ncbi:hypothetical protein SASPL_148054 [Salvia splendens]|uniref:DUF668 domain-containing protein n=1 Tax=Salvia splendens TaxID=180675 RepID=A0A8X8W8L0_SALSN|nr:hypothetical protein SASPL_148054 [Salvia splendens]
MGGLCSRRSTDETTLGSALPHVNGRFSYGPGLVYQSRGLDIREENIPRDVEVTDKQPREPFSFPELSSTPHGTNMDDINDGIPRLSRALSDKSRSTRTKQVALTKVSEMSTLLGRAGHAGLGKAVDVLDTLGSSMTNLNLSSGFASGIATKGIKISILAFEVANTIVKGANLMNSLAEENIRHLKEVVLPSEGIQRLTSRDMDELLRIAAADKRDELKVFSGEVIRFGNRCKDPQWHNLDRYFEKLESELTPHKQLKEEAESVIQYLMVLVQNTAFGLSGALSAKEQEQLNWSAAQSSLAADEPLQRIKSELEAGRPAAPHYELVHGILFYKGRFVVPSNSSWIPKLLAEFHITPSSEVPVHNLPASLWATDPPVLPEQVLDRRSVTRDGESHDQVLIQWLGQEELYHEMHALDRFEQDCRRKAQEEDNSNAAHRGDSLAILRAELKSQKKHVKNLKKKSLWSKILEEVMEKLVDIVHYLHLEIHSAFGSSDGYKPTEDRHQKLGSAGLALHYANIITQIDTLVTRSGSVPPSTRDALYQGLPPTIKCALRSRLQSFQLKEEFSVPQIKEEMEKTLQWLVPMATNTTKAHHGFGWVGEWANTGSEMNNKLAGQTDLLRIETLYHADKEKTEAYILDLVLWLHHLISRSRAANGGLKSPVKSPIRSPNQKTLHLSSPIPSSPSSTLSVEDQEMLRDVSKRKLTPGISKSQEFSKSRTSLSKRHRLTKSNSHSPTHETMRERDPFPIRRPLKACFRDTFPPRTLVSSLQFRVVYAAHELVPSESRSGWGGRAIAARVVHGESYLRYTGFPRAIEIKKTGKLR